MSAARTGHLLVDPQDLPRRAVERFEPLVHARGVDDPRDPGSLDPLAVLVDERPGVAQPFGRGIDALQPADRVAGGLALRAGRAERPTRRDCRGDHERAHRQRDPLSSATVRTYGARPLIAIAGENR